jgi:tetratricopeptide (TPR) repeat protein
VGLFGNGHDCIRGPAKGREVADSEKLSQAIALLDGGDTAGGERVLRDVCSRAPQQYEYCSVDGGKCYLRAWDMEEFVFFIARQPEGDRIDTEWLVAVYPPACFRLGFLLVGRGEYPEALRWLLLGAQMEPQRPAFPLEAGNAYGHCGDHQGALNCFENALALPDLEPVAKAAALRGMGVNLIDLGRLSDAEDCLRAAVAAEPGNQVAVARAKEEFTHIAMLRARGAG